MATTIWYFLRNFKPFRTFYQALSGFLAAAAGGELVGLESIDWPTALSVSALAAVASFVMAMAGGDSLWTEEKIEVAGKGKHRKELLPKANK